MFDQSPWLSIWMRPRETIQAIAAQNPRQSLWLLAFIYGFTSLLNGFQSFPLAQQYGIVGILLISVIIAPLWGYLFFAIWSYVVLWVGKLFKGQGNFDSIRAAYAWSCVPLVANILLWLVLMVFYGDFLFFSVQDPVMLPGSVAILFLMLIVKLVFSIWSIVIYLQALAQVQQFSILHAIGNVVAASVAIGLVTAVIWVFGVLIFSALAPSVPIDLHQAEWFIQ